MTEVVEQGLKKFGLTISKPILAVICIIFGILVIVVPALLSLIVGIFFIIEGVLLLTDYMELQRQQQRRPQPSSPPQ
ncbi:MAG TPA: hypothetical protein VMS94_04220 [Acidobacteriota bacterium]|nr:hypothetical protein [Acidobacteriota bacterium]